MKAVAVIPKKAGSVHLVEMDKPKVSDVAGGRGVLVEVLRVGACGTDREINNADYGVAPPGSEFLVLGHENFGRVAEIGENVKELAVGDYVVASVRRPGHSFYDQIGEQDFTLDEEYFERGISRLHGYMAEFYAESADFLVKIPPEIADVAVLLEPLSIIEKGIWQAYLIQERLKIWKPKSAAIFGAGTVGLLTAMAFRVRGIEVHMFSRQARVGYLNADLLEAIGATYDSTAELPPLETVKKYGGFDMVFECTGFSPLAFDGMQILAKNGVLILSSVTGGIRTIDAVPSDKINQQFVLGNRVMVGTVNAGHEHFELGVRDLALSEAMYPGWLKKLLTHKVEGLENFAEVFDILNNSAKYNSIKAYFEVGKQ
jgi:glucose 1-dehydrogenase